QDPVLLVHGRGFNWKDPDHVRIVYLPRVDELAEIQEQMSRFLRQYRR
ncbi:aminotransferase, partial [Streptococcus suis]